MSEAQEKIIDILAEANKRAAAKEATKLKAPKTIRGNYNLQGENITIKIEKLEVTTSSIIPWVFCTILLFAGICFVGFLAYTLFYVIDFH